MRQLAWLWLITGLMFSSTQAGTTVIRNARVMNSDASAFSDPMSVVVVDGVISTVGGAPETGNADSRINAAGGYLLPGFIDMHAHILIPDCRMDPAIDGGFNVALSEAMLGVLLDFGITTIRSPANPTLSGLALRDRANAGKLRSPHVLAASELINDRSLGTEGIRERIQRDAALKPDFIKLYSALPEPMVRAGVDEAHGLGIPVIGHMGATSWRQGAEAGIDQLTHALDFSLELISQGSRDQVLAARRARGSIRARIDWLEAFDPDGPEATAMVEALARHRVTLDPSLVAYASKFTSPDTSPFRSNPALDRIPDLRDLWQHCGGVADDWMAEDYARWAAAYPKIPRLLQRLHAAGVMLTTGSDTANPWIIPGESLHQEFELLLAAGFSSREVLRMATTNAARALRLERRIGRVDVGYEADLVLLQESPLEDIRHTRSIVWVMADGRIVSAPGE